jgi:hypothetical protein
MKYGTDAGIVYADHTLDLVVAYCPARTGCLVTGKKQFFVYWREAIRI